MAQTKFEIFGPSRTPTTRQENAKLHAELQLVHAGLEKDSTLGVSKAPCVKCDETLQANGVTSIGFPEGSSNQKPKNWDNPETSENVVKKQFTINPKKVDS